MREPLVSVIVVNYNGRRYLKGCFDSLLQGTFTDFELIFVDNGSMDSSVEFVRDTYPDAAVVDNRENLGLAVASNLGARRATGKYLFFFNNDTVAGPSMLQRLVDAAQADPSAGVLGCTTYTYDGGELINSGVACDIFGYPFGRGEALYVDAAIFMRKAVFEEIGGFDPEMFLYGEDRDICWRALLYGYNVRIVEGAYFLHDSFCALGAKGLQTNLWKRQVGERNLLRSLLKNYSALTLAWILPAYLAIGCAEMALFLAIGRPGVVWSAYLKAYWWNAARLRGTLRLRRKIQQDRRVSDLFIQGKMGKVPGKLELLRRAGIPRFA